MITKFSMLQKPCLAANQITAAFMTNERLPDFPVCNSQMFQRQVHLPDAAM